MISFTVVGEAQPAGSKRAFVVNGRAVVSDANAKSRPWKQEVAQVAHEAYVKWAESQVSMPGDIALLGCPLEVQFVFFQPRPKGHYGTGRNAGILKPLAPRFPATRPDVLKLARGVEDALTGVVWRDDSQIVCEHLFKCYGEPARVEVRIWTNPTGAATTATTLSELAA